MLCCSSFGYLYFEVMDLSHLMLLDGVSLSYFHKGLGYGNLVIGMYVLMQFWSSLVQQERSEDNTGLGLG